jgi:hypothetical protein
MKRIPMTVMHDAQVLQDGRKEVNVVASKRQHDVDRASGMHRRRITHQQLSAL